MIKYLKKLNLEGTKTNNFKLRFHGAEVGRVDLDHSAIRLSYSIDEWNDAFYEELDAEVLNAEVNYLINEGIEEQGIYDFAITVRVYDEDSLLDEYETITVR